MSYQREGIPAKYFFREIDERLGEAEPPPLLSVSIHHGVQERAEVTDRESRADDFRTYKRCARGDIVINRMRAFQGAVGISSSDGLVSPDYAVLRVNQDSLDATFFHHLARSAWFVGEMTARLRGIGSSDLGTVRTPRINVRDLGAIRLRVPPLSVQRVIADFLDRRTRAIDELIRKKERLITLFEEKRQALITHAVTKGLDRNVPMKNSGVPSLGEIPAHWDLSLLMHLTQADRRIMYGIVLPGPHVPGGVPIVKGGDVKPGRLRLDALSRTSPEIEARYTRSRLAPGDLVFTIRGGVGDVEIVPCELNQANLTQDAARVAPATDVVGRWLLLFLRSHAAYSQIEPRILGATVRGINIRDLKRVVVPVPPRGEQQRLADVVSRQCDRLDAVINRVEVQIAKLREYRQALIAVAVTGQTDVTAEAAA